MILTWPRRQSRPSRRSRSRATSWAPPRRASSSTAFRATKARPNMSCSILPSACATPWRRRPRGQTTQRSLHASLPRRNTLKSVKIVRFGSEDRRGELLQQGCSFASLFGRGGTACWNTLFGLVRAGSVDLLQVEAVQVHHLGPCSHKVLHKPLACIATAIHLGNGA
jgi:hypothetical protein